MKCALAVALLLATLVAAQGASVTVVGPSEPVPFAKSYTVEVRVTHPLGTEVIEPQASDFAPLIVDRIVKSASSGDTKSLRDTFVVSARAETLGNVTLGRLELRVKGGDGTMTTVTAAPLTIAVASALRASDGFELDPVTPHVETWKTPNLWLIVLPTLVIAWMVWRSRHRESKTLQALMRLEQSLLKRDLSPLQAWPLLVVYSSHVLSKDAASMTATEWSHAMTSQLGTEHRDLITRVGAARDAMAFGAIEGDASAREDVATLVGVLRRAHETSA